MLWRRSPVVNVKKKLLYPIYFLHYTSDRLVLIFQYSQSLEEDLKCELRGDFEEIVLALLMKPMEYDAYCLHEAVKGLGTDEAVLIAILSNRTGKVSQGVPRTIMC